MTNTVVLCTLLAALVVSLFVLAIVEASFLHVRRSAVASNAATGDPRSVRLLALLDDLPRVMNAILLAVLMAQVTAASLAGVLARRWFGGVGVTVATVAVTVVLFIYGEAIPKTIAIRRPMHYALRLSWLVRFLNVVLAPFVNILVFIAELQDRGAATGASVSAVSEEELRHLTGEAAAAGEIERSDAVLIEFSFTLGDLRVDDIAIPMEDVAAVHSTTPVSEVLELAIATGHRRLPVHDTSPLKIVGFVRLRDLAQAITADAGTPVVECARPALAVRGSTLVIDALRSMQTTGQHLGVVVNHDGDALGIVTIEDIVDEFMGAIEEP